MTDDTPPWVRGAPEPRVTAQPAVAVRQRQPQVETVHWGVVALTVITAICVLVGASGNNDTRSQELLPIVMSAR